jgi:uncharacterized oxidoreductase
MKKSGNTVVITGGSSGIGLALAQAFLQAGNQVVITGRDVSKLDNARRTFPSLECLAGDLTQPEDFSRLVHTLEQRYPALNVLVNNAAIQYNYAFPTEPDAAIKIEQEIATNLTAPIKLTAALLPLLAKNKESAVVNVSSGLFISPKQSASVYCATKAAIHSFSKTLRFQLQPQGIRVFEIIPPLVDTPMTTGRGKGKLSAHQLAAAFVSDFERDRFESYIGKSKLLKWINRISPKLSDRIMINS